jgi:hypothetical protein
MRLNSGISFFALLKFLCVLGGFALAASSLACAEDLQREAVRNHAAEYLQSTTGGSTSVALSSHEILSYSDSALPFLSHLVDGRRVVVFEGWPVVVYRGEPASSPSTDTGVEFTFNVLADAETGLFITAHHPAMCEDCLVPPDPSSGEAERQLSSGGERYIGFPELPPTVSLAEILAGDFLFVHPYADLDITAQYFLYGKDSASAVPAWVISLKGLPPVESPRMSGSAPAPVPVHQKVVLRFVFDASTGAMLRCNNVPTMPGKWNPSDTTQGVHRRY